MSRDRDDDCGRQKDHRHQPADREQAGRRDRDIDRQPRLVADVEGEPRLLIVGGAVRDGSQVGHRAVNADGRAGFTLSPVGVRR